ncbi:MAG: Glycerophosphoryl diester phosphodiesterase [uncultured Nocardioidaceae bacterium]|uniref:Glycerophosphoryl diester phosphodiesterase n=1 Tax=uncultured Nocardioidaceae bacterium TaxID=253824 RepID=A0A6J4KYZ5_9ACTN|nr:MAG: Glycerophosphoryl diester phosphodiesterase [uncultured Nocardioidaceae bacterium]
MIASVVLLASAFASAGAARADDRSTTADRAFAAAATDAGRARTVDGLPALVLDAHRAGGLEARENSLSGIDHALDSGVVDVVDLDVRRLGDGSLGVMHDPTVDRVTTSTGATSAYTREEWQALTLDIGSWLVPEPEPEAPPTLAEVLRRFGDRTVFTVEVKEGLLDEVAALLRDRRLTDSVLVNTNEPDVARAVHELGLRSHLWRTRTQMRTDDPRRWAGWLDVVDVDVRARRALLEDFVDSGVPRVWAHTVTTRAARDRAVRLGADGIVTDDPRYVAGLTDRYPASPTVVTVQRSPRTVQVSDRTEARVVVSSESGPVLPEGQVTIGSRVVTGRTVARPRPGVSTVRISAAAAEKGRTRVRFVVVAGSGEERRWPTGRTSVRLRVAGEDLQLLPSPTTDGRVLEVGVRLLDSAARDYTGPAAERGTGVGTVADLARAGLRLQVIRDGEVVHRQRRDGADTGTTGDGAGRVVFTPYEAEQRGPHTVRVVQRGPVYRHVVVEQEVRLG